MKIGLHDNKLRKFLSQNFKSVYFFLDSFDNQPKF